MDSDLLNMAAAVIVFCALAAVLYLMERSIDWDTLPKDSQLRPLRGGIRGFLALMLLGSIFRFGEFLWTQHRDGVVLTGFSVALIVGAVVAWILGVWFLRDRARRVVGYVALALIVGTTTSWLVGALTLIAAALVEIAIALHRIADTERFGLTNDKQQSKQPE